MKLIIALLLLLLLPTIVLADTFVCQQNGARTVSNSPCPPGAKMVNQIVEIRPLTPAPAPDSATQNFRQQLTRVRQNQADLDARHAESKPLAVAPQAPGPQVDKTAACERNWEAIRAVDASARAYSTDYHRAEKQRLQDQRWKLGC